MNLQHQLAEERVRPREPRPRELLRIIPIKRFMHEARSRVRRLEPPEAGTNLSVVAAGQCAHDDSQRPDHIQSDVWSAYAFARAPAKEVGIVLAQHECPRSYVGGVVSAATAEVRERQ